MSDPGRDLFASRTGVSHETLARLDCYADLLRTWNPKINLVGPSTLPALWERHFLDSAQLFPHLPVGGGMLADFGSGAGFPGLVLAILGAPCVHLIESDQRKAAFLREVSRETGAGNVTVHAARLADVAPLGADVVTARALAPLTDLIPWAIRHLKPGGTALFLKGADTEKEIAKARETCSFSADVLTSQTHPDGRLLRLTAITTRIRP